MNATRVLASPGLAWPGVSWLGLSWLDLAWLGWAGLGLARLGLARLGSAWFGFALLGEQVASVEESPGGKGEEAHLAWASCWRLVLRVDDMCAPNR